MCILNDINTLKSRPGTENTPMIVGLGVAAQLVTNNLGIETYTVYKLDIQAFWLYGQNGDFLKG